MKKVLTILAVLIVLTSAVFAASEVHTIRVKADVTEVVPAFQLWLGATKTNTAPVVFTNNETYNLVDDATAIDTGFNLDEGGFVTVFAKLANAAKTTKSYTLKFSDGVFNVKKNTSDDTLEPTIVTTALSAFTGISSITKVTPAAEDSDISVAFNGTTVTDPADLAKAVYTYAATPTIDPGVYYANIVLTVSTT